MSNGRLTFRRPAEPQRGGAKFVSVLSGKGGVGKSVIAFNLAERLAAEGYRTLVADCDWHCGNVHILANMAADYGLREYLGGRLSLAEAVGSFNDSLDILPMPMSIGFEPPAVGDTGRFLQRFRHDTAGYDFVIMDHSSGASNQTAVLAHGSDLNVIVLVPELTSISDGYGLFKFLLNLDRSLESALVINRAESEREAEYIQGKFFAMAQRFLGTVPGYLGWLEDRDLFRQSVARQKPLAAVDSAAPSVEQIRRISRKLAANLAVAGTSPLTAIKKAINETPATADIRG